MSAFNAPRRPWWKRKRWIIASVIWFGALVLYPAVYGPIVYACCRGWLGTDTFRATYRVYRPLSSTLDAIGLGRHWRAYDDAIRKRGFGDRYAAEGAWWFQEDVF